MTPASAKKMLFFIIYSIQKIKIKEVPKNPKILLRTRQESMTWRNDFSQECNQLRLFTASDVAGAGRREFSVIHIDV
ncbi:hypothetical protein L9H42_000245 [Klebsiella quasipneumoniae]|nr:hypothetical protein [Klebsiella quasipneumoniae]